MMIYKIYLDMDGVISDWESQFKRYSGNVSVDDYDAKYGKKNRFKFVEKNCPEYYATMPWMKDGKVLLDFIKEMPVEILSHAPSKLSHIGKKEWLSNNNINVKANLVPQRNLKSKFANNKSILIDDREDNVNDFIKAGGKAILHKNAIDTINQLKNYITMQESSYRIYNSLLNPDLWQNDELKPDVKEKLINIAKTFFESTELNVPLEDVLLLGSAAGYNWTPTSDVDLHLVIDFDKVNDNQELVQKYVDGLKSAWNDKHKISINNHPVEVYIQDVDHETNSLGIYSLINNEWLKKPVYNVPKIDKDAIKKKYKEISKEIETGIQSNDSKKLENILKKLYVYRQSGLDKSGEFSTENIVFKLLRSTQHLKKLKDGIVKITDKKLSK